MNMWGDDYIKDDQDSAGYADTLEEAKFIGAVLAAFMVFCWVMFWGVPAFARWVVS